MSHSRARPKKQERRRCVRQWITISLTGKLNQSAFLAPRKKLAEVADKRIGSQALALGEFAASLPLIAQT